MVHLLCLAVLLRGTAMPGVSRVPIANARVSIDMVQNNPGDPVGWEQSKYFQPSVLKELGYTGQTSEFEPGVNCSRVFNTISARWSTCASNTYRTTACHYLLLPVILPALHVQFHCCKKVLESKAVLKQSTLAPPATITSPQAQRSGSGWMHTYVYGLFSIYTCLWIANVRTFGEIQKAHSPFHLCCSFSPTHPPTSIYMQAVGVKRYVDRATAAGVSAYFFVDLLVFPTPVLAVWKNVTDSTGNVVWNNATKQLLAYLVDETFAQYPNNAGWIVRTGETYTYDTPYHKGNSPNPRHNPDAQDLWVDFITELRSLVCVKHQKQLFFRGWDNWASNAAAYTAMTDRIPTHSLLYFSIKHSAADFVRPAVWNPQLGVGQHAQIVEVELQREYEGKGAYPNYIMDGVIDGFHEMPSGSKFGLKDIIRTPQLKGLWTWTRGGGWWGPYIHGNEQWIDLHAQVLMKWWNKDGAITEEEAFAEVAPELLPGCDVSSGCAAAFRKFSQSAADVVLYGQWGVVAPCGDWMRDDRLGGLTQVSCLGQLGNDMAKWSAALAEKTGARDLAASNLALFESAIKPHITDSRISEVVEVSALYAVHLYKVVAAGWILLEHAYRQTHSLKPDLLTPAELTEAIATYDAATGAYRVCHCGGGDGV